MHGVRKQNLVIFHMIYLHIRWIYVSVSSTGSDKNSTKFFWLHNVGETRRGYSQYIYTLLSTLFPCAFEGATLPVKCNIVGLVRRYRPSTDCRYTCTAIDRGLVAVWTVYCCFGRCTAGVLVLSELGTRLQYDQYTTVQCGGGVPLGIGTGDVFSSVPDTASVGDFFITAHPHLG